MLDEYWFGDTARISPEAPVPVVRARAAEQRPGGAANVALNVAALGAQQRARSHHRQRRTRGPVDPRARATRCALRASCARQTLPTIHKLRVLARSQQLLRIDAEQPLHSCAAEFGALFAKLVRQADAVILSDYAKGTLSRVERAYRGGARRWDSGPRRSEGYRLQALSRRLRVDAEPRRSSRPSLVNARTKRTSCAKARRCARSSTSKLLLVTRGEQGHDVVRARRRAADAARRKRAKCST